MCTPEVGRMGFSLPLAQLLVLHLAWLMIEGSSPEDATIMLRYWVLWYL